MWSRLLVAAALVTAALCDSASTCEDRHGDCRYWAHKGECRSNWDWMTLHCSLSCGSCLGICRDLEESCAEWAELGECVENERFMVERCPSSCDLCPTLRPPALRCDACLALQEAIWRHLAQAGDSSTGRALRLPTTETQCAPSLSPRNPPHTTGTTDHAHILACERVGPAG